MEIVNCDTSIYTMDHPDFIVCSFMENSIGLKRVYSHMRLQGISAKNKSETLNNCGNSEVTNAVHKVS